MEILFFRRQNEEISKILLQVVDELKIVCHNLESELNQF
ncbi:TPA: MCP-domain signal transduction protein [Campylobacter jejuni]|nr:MCP-domain signal transduction protein [Campylobacter jejuni]